MRLSASYHKKRMFTLDDDGKTVDSTDLYPLPSFFRNTPGNVKGAEDATLFFATQ